MAAFDVDAASTAVPREPTMNFSNQELWGKRPCYDLHDNGTFGGAGVRYWYQYGGADNGSLVTNYETVVERYARFTSSLNPQPSYMASGEDNLGYAMIRVGYPLARTFRNVEEDGESSVVMVPESDLFVDTLVRFYPRAVAPTEVPTVEVRGRAKFMCWLSAVGGATNLVVTAGHYGADDELERANYVATNCIEVGKWYRLTARAIANASTRSDSSAPAFVLYLDGEPVACAAEQYAIGDDAAAMFDLFGGNEYFSKRALFPPICRYVGQNPGLYGVAVAGRADLDEFAVVDEGDPLQHSASELEVAVACDPLAVTSVCCQVTHAGAGEPYFVTNSYGEAEVLFKAGPGDRVAVSALPGKSVALKELVLSGNPDAISDQSGFEFSLVNATEFESAARITARITTGGAQYRVGDRTYETFEEAVVAASESGETLLLESDINLDADTDNGQMRVRSLYDIRLDLCGHTIVGNHFDEEAAIYDQGRLEIFDSVGGGAIVAPGEAIEVVADNDALNVNHRIAALTIGSTAALGEFSVKGRVRVTAGELKVMGGKFLTPPALEPRSDFYLADYLASDRFKATDQGTQAVGGKLCHWWSVAFDGRYLVKYRCEYGTVSPTATNVDVTAGAKLVRPQVTAPGYAVTNWQVTATGASWSFDDDEVTGDMTLLAQQELERYTITYDEKVAATAPTSYTVETELTKLPELTHSYYTFDGWRDAASGLKVDYVGAGAVFVGTETAVTGNLELAALWVPKTLEWENTSAGLMESNGCYSGSWELVVPVRAELPFGSKVAIDEIAFCIVNPLTYPKTSPCLKVTTADGEVAISEVREDYYDDVTAEYAVGANLLRNGRARVGYGFTDLTVQLGKTNRVEFCDALGAASVSGFLRLAHRPQQNDALFGNCLKAGAPEQYERYEEYCPLYEIKGHAVKEVTP